MTIIRPCREFFRSYWVGILVLLGSGCTGQAITPKTAGDSTDYYQTADFASVPKMDAHVHIRTNDTAFAHQARLNNFRLLTIVVDEPPGMEKQEQWAIGQIRRFPKYVSFATTFPVAEWNSPEWSRKTIDHLRKSFENGTIAVKLYKNIGMALKDREGHFVMIDNPRFDEVLDFLSKNNIPVIGHLGEPKDCWLPLARMQMESNRKYYRRHPEYHMFLHPGYPDYDQQIAARDHMLEKHPDLRFIGAHLGSIEWNTDTLAAHLDKLPNMLVDMAARMGDLQFLAQKDWQKVHDFFIRYQDRLLYGTDRIADDSKPGSEMAAFCREAWLQDWKFLATGDSLRSASVDGGFRGLHLPRKVIDKIYNINIGNLFRKPETSFRN